MNNIVKKRLEANFKKQMHYLTLVFNDFFILALIFLFGALMFWYAQNIKKWPSNLWFYSPLLALIWTITLSFGNFTSLLQRADEHFLFNQDKNMKEYFRPLYSHSMILPMILILLVSGLLFPFATTRAGISFATLIWIVVGLLASKITQFKLIVKSFYFNKRNYYNFWLFVLINFVLLTITISTNSLLYDAIMVACWVSVSYLPQGAGFNWYKAVDYEEKRQDLLANFYSMFTDVPDKKVKISRLKYLDFLLSHKKQTPNTFLYQRSLLRDPEYNNLLIRMSLFSILLSWTLQDYKWATGLGALVIFLTLYQLIPLGTVYEHNMMYHVMPIEQKTRNKDLARVLQKGMLIEWLLISVGLVVFSPEKIYALFAAIGLLIFTFILLYAYLPVRIESLFKKIRY